MQHGGVGLQPYRLFELLAGLCVETRGRFAGLDEEGALLLDDGERERRITAGDVFPAS